MGAGDEKKYLSLISLLRKSKIRQIKKDGNCLFRAIAFLYYDDVGLHEFVREEIAESLRNDKNYYIMSGAFDETWTRDLTGKGSSYEDYVTHVATPRYFGDSGCLLVFQRLHESFNYMVWSPVAPSVVFTEAHPHMTR